jgi:nucleoid-associated protein YgaU
VLADTGKGAKERETDTMGLMSFIKEAGRKLGIGKAEAAQPEGSPAPETPTPADLEQELKDLGLKTEGLKVEVEGDKVKVTGAVPDQATKEKVLLALGNVAGVAAVEEAVTPETAEAEAVMYTVKKGDTLSAIAKAHYGEGAKYMAIFEANRPMLKHPDKIYPGQTLRIPPEPK